ncbi:MAG: hypothetical protein AB7Q17_10875 [Phycisphaerae bacterium]
MLLSRLIPRRATRAATLAALGAALALLAGCRLMALPFLMWGEEPTKTVAAEYADLGGKKIAVAVWAEMDTRFEYPFVQLEIAEHVRAALEASLKGTTFVPARQIVEHQKRNPEWERGSPGALAARFKADRVLLVELSQYSTREPDSPHLLRGRISAAVKVYGADEQRDAPLYRTTVDTVFPEDSVGQFGVSDDQVRRATMEAFASDVARKFHEHKIKVKKS